MKQTLTKTKVNIGEFPGYFRALYQTKCKEDEYAQFRNLPCYMLWGAVGIAIVYSLLSSILKEPLPQ